MLPSGVTQRITGWPYGECVRASYATILGLPIEAVPRLDPGASLALGEEQGSLERAWLATIGLGLIEIAMCHEHETLPQEVLDCLPEGVMHLMSGVSPRGFAHRCVGIGGRVAFDPHPDRTGLLTVYSIGMLVPL